MKIVLQLLYALEAVLEWATHSATQKLSYAFTYYILKVLAMNESKSFNTRQKLCPSTWIQFGYFSLLLLLLLARLLKSELWDYLIFTKENLKSLYVVADYKRIDANLKSHPPIQLITSASQSSILNIRK